MIPPPQVEGVNAMRSIALTGGGRRMIARPSRLATLEISPASRGGIRRETLRSAPASRGGIYVPRHRIRSYTPSSAS